MKKTLTDDNILFGAERAVALFAGLAEPDGRWITREAALRYRGVGRAMVRRVFDVARHVEGGKMSRSLGKRGVDVVDLESVQSAVGRLMGPLLAGKKTSRLSSAGASLRRFIARISVE